MIRSSFRALVVSAPLTLPLAAGAAASDESVLLARARAEPKSPSTIPSTSKLRSESSKPSKRHPGIKVSVETSGAQRLLQEYKSDIHNSDVVNSADAA